MLGDFFFLDEETVIGLHDDQLRLFTPGENPAIRDLNGLRSAIISPQQAANFNTDSTLFQLAAFYAYNISMAQAFINGNKRTGLQCALVFLDMNGYVVESATRVLFDKVSGMDIGLHKRAEFAEFLEKYSNRSGGLTEWFRRLLYLKAGVSV